jgi:hypothetical protein
MSEIPPVIIIMNRPQDDNTKGRIEFGKDKYKFLAFLALYLGIIFSAMKIIEIMESP